MHPATHSSCHASQDTTSRSSLRPSAPVDIPCRHKAKSPLPIFCASSCHSTSPASELLFEMSPFEDDVCSSLRKKSAIHSSPLCSDSTLAVNRANTRDVHYVQSSLRKRYKPYSPASISPHNTPVKLPHYQAPEKRRTLTNPPILQNERVTTAPCTPPPVIRTTAVHKISGFTPTNPTPERPPQERPPRLPLTPSSIKSSLPSSPSILPGARDDDGDSYVQSPLDFEKFLVYRFERRRIRPHYSTSRVS
ncbi:hypothetical protein BT96DRAFT_559036 [Gymnopus androsaceus JB14]|uniref:Uncharacterized protein n=1 Tax=Gymnopus androsaceus JB14 TaxID=1447944 RepID=A0A6A4I046_9AGAR|nr:hypothetical protein BT96DRAFT_559036 [Gymnopus androsaceus JB14]